jgi:hypothetical protein
LIAAHRTVATSALAKCVPGLTTAIMSVLSFESILQNFRYRRGLYLLGAGSSAGLAPIGHGLYRIAALDWWRNGGGFSPDIPVHSPLVQKIIESQIDCPQEEIWGRPIRIGTEPFPAREMLQQLPNGAARLHVMHELLKKRHENEATDSYGVFRAFHPSIILNYNHDGFAVAQCGDKHWVIDIHGSIEPWYGSPDVKELIGRVREFDVSIPTGDLIMCERETRDNVTLLRRLAAAAAVMPDFVAIIGYSFARVPDGHDDCVSFDWFRHKFRGFNGPIFVIDPHPEELASEIADAIKSPHVFDVTALWNHLSHAFVMHMEGCGDAKSIYADHEKLRWRYGDQHTFGSTRSR